MAAADVASGREEAALEALAEAGRRNQENLLLATRDRDFEPLWEQEKFQELVAPFQPKS